MENATDALIMAGSVLLLIIALTVTISSLSNLKTQTQDLLDDRDQLLATKDENGGYINYLKSGGKDSDVRIVGIETVMSSITRMPTEDDTIYIQTNETVAIPNDLKVIFQGNNYIRLAISSEEKEKEKQYLYDKDVTGAIYNSLKFKKFKEYIGIYQNKTAEGVSDANKATHKIITYEQIN